MTLRRPQKFLALLMVLMISLIINPAFAMSGHQNSSLPASPDSTHHQAVHNAGSDSHHIHHQIEHSNASHCADCGDGEMMNPDHCGSDGDNQHCKSCTSSHCQYSALPVFYLTQSNASDKDTPQRLLVSAPISRQETSLRPPIH